MQWPRTITLLCLFFELFSIIFKGCRTNLENLFNKIWASPADARAKWNFYKPERAGSCLFQQLHLIHRNQFKLLFVWYLFDFFYPEHNSKRTRGVYFRLHSLTEHNGRTKQYLSELCPFWLIIHLIGTPCIFPRNVFPAGGLAPCNVALVVHIHYFCLLLTYFW